MRRRLEDMGFRPQLLSRQGGDCAGLERVSVKSVQKCGSAAADDPLKPLATLNPKTLAPKTR